MQCAGCGATLPGDALSCPSCRQLVHAAELERLAREAQEKERAGEIAASIQLLRQALQLLPFGSAQASAIRARVAALGSQLSTARENPKAQSSWKKRLGPFGVVLALLAKFKTVILVALTKGKFLLLGFTKLNTLLSMFASMGLYWALYGWKFAVGFILGIYVHEMGHVWALRHFGLRASAPMFIPGFGAFVSLYDSPANVGQDARIGLAGPTWGAAAALACLIPGYFGGSGLWMAVAHATAYINLFNLIPVWQLDGGRGFRALNRQERLMLLVLMAALWWITGEGMLIFLTLGAAYRIFWTKDYAPEGDRGVLFEFAGLLILFGALLRFAR